MLGWTLEAQIACKGPAGLHLARIDAADPARAESVTDAVACGWTVHGYVVRDGLTYACVRKRLEAGEHTAALHALATLLDPDGLEARFVSLTFGTP